MSEEFSQSVRITDQSLELWELLQSSSFTINLWNCGNYYKVRVLRSIFEIVGTLTNLKNPSQKLRIKSFLNF
ncbi:hypothetical protein LEP1GSC073_2490 [Leptospira noguchii str. Cascata]|nr:hypothetical protein LEP1GSC073_2490 [Leptospira noguchii str. Cascata]